MKKILLAIVLILFLPFFIFLIGPSIFLVYLVLIVIATCLEGMSKMEKVILSVVLIIVFSVLLYKAPGIALLLCATGIVVIYNKMKKAGLSAEKAKSGIDVYCQQRFDLIPNLVEVVKGYSEHEKSVFENIAKLRTEYNVTKDLKTAQEINNQLNEVIIRTENYPELKANEQFLNLQKSLVKMENQLQAARRIYNDEVTKYNTVIQIFPNNIVAKIFKFKEMDLFEIHDVAAAQVIKTNFKE